MSMGVYIKGMKMPEKESVVILISPSGDVWMIGDMPNEDTHLIKAKAFPVPPHGDLIDRGKLREKEFIHEGDAYAVVMSRDIRNAPTIIEAEDGE